ncbi:hypothetical protein ACIQRW_21995 [Streptomyces sp. NPDC091287]
MVSATARASAWNSRIASVAVGTEYRTKASGALPRNKGYVERSHQ